MCRRRLPPLLLGLGLTAARAAGPSEGPLSACGGDAVAAWTSAEHKAAGYHVLCLGPSGPGCAGGSGAASEDSSSPGAVCRADGQMAVSICWDGSRVDCEEFALAEPGDLVRFEEALIERRPLKNPTRYNKLKQAAKRQGWWGGQAESPGLFGFYKVTDPERTPTRIKSPAELSGLVLAFEGGSFLWPGVEVGFRRNITITPDDGEALALQLVTRSLRPLILEVSRFLLPSECQHIIEKATPHIRKSAVSHMDHDVGKPDTNWRSSSTYFMASDDEVLWLLDERISALTVTGTSHQEYTQVLRYERGERYAAHHDYFDPAMYAKNDDIMSMTEKGLYNRMATVFFYLTTVEEGGHTNFPRAGGLPVPNSFEDCSRGVSIDPQEGRIIIFYSQDPAGQLDEYSLHGGCSVGTGTKWSANKWIWNKPMPFTTEH